MKGKENNNTNSKNNFLEKIVKSASTMNTLV